MNKKVEELQAQIHSNNDKITELRKEMKLKTQSYLVNLKKELKLQNSVELYDFRIGYYDTFNFKVCITDEGVRLFGHSFEVSYQYDKDKLRIEGLSTYSLSEEEITKIQYYLTYSLFLINISNLKKDLKNLYLELKDLIDKVKEYRLDSNSINLEIRDIERNIKRLKKEEERKGIRTYKDINFRSLAKMFDLDFSYHTYLRGQCSCCFGPQDIPQGWVKEVKDKPKYLLGKNAYNGSGIVKLKDDIKDYFCISHGNLTLEELEPICKELQNRLGDKYRVECPKDLYTTIVIYIN